MLLLSSEFSTPPLSFLWVRPEFSACFCYDPCWHCPFLFSSFRYSSLFRCGFVSSHVHFLLICGSRLTDCNCMSILLKCSSDKGIGIFPCCASWISCNSSCSVNSGLTILRFVSLCRASGESMFLSRVCFCCSSCCCIWALRCSSEACCRSAESFLRRSSSSSSSDTTIHLSDTSPILEDSSPIPC